MDNTPAQVAPLQSNEQATVTPPQPKSKKKILWLTLAGFVMLVLLTGGILFLTRNTGTTDPSKPQTTNTTQSPAVTLFQTAEELKENTGYTLVYGVQKDKNVFVKAHNIASGNTYQLATLSADIKKISFVNQDRIVYINKTNEFDNGQELVYFNTRTTSAISVIRADTGFVIDDYVISPNGQYIALWQIEPNAGGTLIGGKSQVTTLSLEDPQIRHQIYNETANYDAPVHYPSAILDDGTVVMDSFVPNSGAGWAYGVSISNFDGSQKQDVATLKNGMYGTKLVTSPNGRIAFGGYDGGKGEGSEVIDGFRRSVISVNSVELFHPVSQRRTKLIGLDAQNIYNFIVWDAAGEHLLFEVIAKDPKESGKYMYSITDEKAYKLDLDEAYAVNGTLPNAIHLVGRQTDGEARLGPTYSREQANLSLMQNTKLIAPLSLEDQVIQVIALKESSYFPEVLGDQTALLAQETRQNLQLLPFRPTLTPVPTRGTRQTDPLPTNTPRPNEPTPTRTPTNRPNQPTATRSPAQPTATPAPAEGWRWRICAEIARPICQQQHDPRDVKQQPALSACIKKLSKELEQQKQCAISPLYLYGKEGTEVSVQVLTPIWNTIPKSRGTYRVTLGAAGNLLVGDSVYESLAFDYAFTLKRYEKPTRGIVTKRSNLPHVLKDMAQKLGLTQKETNDLIILGKTSPVGEYVFVSFFDQETSKKLLPIAFSPTPDTYINYVFYMKSYAELPQTIPASPVYPSQEVRVGFTAVEISAMIE